MQHKDIHPGQLYAAGTRNTFQYPALVVHTRLWTCDPREKPVIRRALPGEYRGRRYIDRTPVDTGVLVIHHRVLSTPDEKVLPLLQNWALRVKFIDWNKQHQVDRVRDTLQNQDLHLGVLITRNVLCEWRTYVANEEQQYRYRLQAAQVERDRRRGVVRRIRQRVQGRGPEPRMEVISAPVAVRSTVSAPHRISMGVDEMLRMVEVMSTPNRRKDSSMTVTDDGWVELKFTSIQNIYHVSAVLGAPAPWFDRTHPTELLDHVYPAEGGAYVVERTPPDREHVIKKQLKKNQRIRDRGVFRVMWVSMSGTIEPVPDNATFQSRSGAMYAAQKRSERTWSRERA